MATAIEGSFRDPGSQVFEKDGRIVRAVWRESAADYEAFRDSGFMSRLIDAKKLVGAAEIEAGSVNLPKTPAYLLEHPRLPLVSYPYEWPFSLLKRAALFHLDLQIEALEAGFTLCDATAYNVQFVCTDPVFIDHLSFRKYQEGEVWQAHRQFCMQFLNPILLWSRKGVSPNSWFRGSLEGIAPGELAPLLSFKELASWTIFTHVFAHASLQKRAVTGKGNQGAKRPQLSRTGFQGMLEGLRSFIAKCESPVGSTVWADYEQDNSYDSERASRKRDFVAEAISGAKPETLIDLGCNSGEYSEIALKAGARRVFGFDFDYGALEAAVARADTKGLAFSPLWLDAANPSPAQGWGQAERMGFDKRANADFVLALAFVHHLAIARNVPLGMVIGWIMDRSPEGVIEFPSKSDPMVQSLLANREDIFPDYTENAFVAEVRKRGAIVGQTHIAEDGRMLIHFRK